ncbi:unnamed protein product [Rhizoctonia solani]|uniref:F-box domain-containing protein n=1 Tax=Rhizoctonia solani TaxID=456999 RepID=A0A8H2WEE6_9AGAM|nr:unnamed protein product [Rhizoctonia solani]
MAEDVAMKNVNDSSEIEPINAQFGDLPNELLREIAKKLYPLDLIHLARVNKFFRRMFMSRTASEVWQATLTNVGLPPCPDITMVEPEYAALMFLKECTECGRPAGRHMDPIFLVRPCSRCRDDMAMSAKKVQMALQPLLSKSPYLVPARGFQRPYWYLRDEYEEVEEEYFELDEAGDLETLGKYVTGRKKLVKDWSEKTSDLVVWVKEREKEYKKEQIRLRFDRKAQIETRLIKLGWGKHDVGNCFYFSGNAKSKAYKAKPLDDRDWNDMLPSLLEGLEKARKQRLDMEASGRLSDREEIIEAWLKSLSQDLGSLNLTLCWKELSDGSTSSSIDTLCARLRQEGCEKQIKIQIPFVPASRYVLKWAPIEELLNQDKPTEEFRPEFNNRQVSLKEQISGWRSNLETVLVKALPETPKPAEVQSSQFHLEAQKGPTQFEDEISAELRTLLRADVIFEYDHKPVYYPTGFNTWTIDAQLPTYDSVSSSVAKGLLEEFQRPDASYLEMNALGNPFVCARCTSDPDYLTWEGIVGHLVYEHERWQSASKWNKRYSEEGEGVTLTFTHDMSNSSKPLVQLVGKPDQITPKRTPETECKVCLSIGQHYRTGGAHIARHIQATHLIDNPVRGEHYT